MVSALILPAVLRNAFHPPAWKGGGFQAILDVKLKPFVFLICLWLLRHNDIDEHILPSFLLL
jgi:hypothetical protein